MRKFLSTILFFFSFMFCIAQQNDKIWTSGAGVTFISTFELDTVTNSIYIDSFVSNNYFAHGNSNICDSSGILQFSSDGLNVYHSGHELMDGGLKLSPNDFYIDENGWSGYSQTSIILPVGNEKYFLITTFPSDKQMAIWHTAINDDSTFFDLLWYNVIDMKENNGMGKVVQSKIPILEDAYLSKPEMMACRHANGRDWWLLKGRYHSVAFHTFLVTENGIKDYGIQSFAHLGADFEWDNDGQCAFNTDGTLFATVLAHRRTINLFDFDRCTGVLSNQRPINVPHKTTGNPNDTTELEFRPTVGIAFSPNNKYLYISGRFNIQQFELNNPDSASAWYHVANLDTTWQNFQGYSNIYLGPDKKLYIGNWNGLSKQMSVINKPDEKGIACEWCPRCMRFSYWGATTPPCMPNYHLGVLPNSPCDTIKLITEPPITTASVQIIIPNAFSPNGDALNETWRILNVAALQQAGISFQTVAVYNRWGNEVFKSNDINFEWSGKGWASDSYYYYIRYSTKEGMSKVQKGSVSLVK